MARSNFPTKAFIQEKATIVEIIPACGLQNVVILMSRPKVYDVPLTLTEDG